MSGPEVAAIALMTTSVAAISITWIRLHYRSASGIASGDLKRLEERLSQIERSIDAIAVEAERISEGQRFTTKLLSERSPAQTPRE
jgi:hypothetical protein